MAPSVLPFNQWTMVRASLVSACFEGPPCAMDRAGPGYSMTTPDQHTALTHNAHAAGTYTRVCLRLERHDLALCECTRINCIPGAGADSDGWECLKNTRDSPWGQPCRGRKHPISDGFTRSSSPAQAVLPDIDCFEGDAAAGKRFWGWPATRRCQPLPAPQS